MITMLKMTWHHTLGCADHMETMFVVVTRWLGIILSVVLIIRRLCLLYWNTYLNAHQNHGLRLWTALWKPKRCNKLTNYAQLTRLWFVMDRFWNAKTTTVSALKLLGNCAPFGEVCVHLKTLVRPLTQTLVIVLSYVAPTPTFPWTFLSCFWIYHEYFQMYFVINKCGKKSTIKNQQCIVWILSFVRWTV